MKRIAFASLFAVTLAAGAAQAQAPDTTGRAPAAAAGNVVGGGVAATIAGGGDNMTITYATGGAGGGPAAPLAQPPRLARARNEAGGGTAVEYLQPETARPGREAWLVGGGDHAEVVYARPR